MWVDTETGVLLKLITIEVEEIEFNKGIEKKLDTQDTRCFQNQKG